MKVNKNDEKRKERERKRVSGLFIKKEIKGVERRKRKELRGLL
jgi:hypothetical protein